MTPRDGAYQINEFTGENDGDSVDTEETHTLSKQNAQTHRTVKNESLIPNFSLFWYTDMQIHHIWLFW